jgi:hypothetical protein
MIMLYPLLIGLVVGAITGGRTERLTRLRNRRSVHIAGGIIDQLALISSPVGQADGDAAPLNSIGTNVAVVAAVLANLAIPGLVAVAAGAASNLAAIIANGGYMPVSEGALRAMGRGPAVGYSNSLFVEAPVLVPLTDIFAMPTWVPMANVFSVGDVLISVGVFVAVVAAMHGRAPLVAMTDAIGSKVTTTA